MKKCTETFNEQTKAEGYTDLGKRKPIKLLEGNYKVSYPIKAKDSDDILFTKKVLTVSRVNPLVLPLRNRKL